MSGQPFQRVPSSGSPTMGYRDEPEHELADDSGYNAPSHGLQNSNVSSRPYSPRSAGQESPLRGQETPPNLDSMPLPVSYLPQGAAAPQRFYAALGNDPAYRNSYASSSNTFFNNSNTDGTSTPTKYAGYNDADYDSVSGLRFGSKNRSSTAFGEQKLYPGGALGGVGAYETYHDNSSELRSEFQMDDLNAHENKRETYVSPELRKKKRFRALGIIAAVIILLCAIAGALIYFFVIRKNHDDSSNGNNSSGSGGGGSSSGNNGPTTPPDRGFAYTGGDGSTITFDDGTTMKYNNSFGGTWYYDPDEPYADRAQAQSYTPRLNETFQFGTDRIYGVNIGGWLNTEPFIVPALYEPFVNAAVPAVDEWTLSTNLMETNGNLDALEDHYKTFITEVDFAEIAAAGLNFVRINFPFWAVSKFPDEPFLEGVAWTYFLKAIEWSRKYGIRINLDLHTIPGSQNAFNHSGRLGMINWLMGTMGIANAQRSLDYIRTITEFISQPQYSNVVVIFGLVNEPFGPWIGQDILGHFYYQAHEIVRNITGRGEGKGPWLSINDGFVPEVNYTGFLAGADRLMMDAHPYLCFQPLMPVGPEQYANIPCNAWGGEINSTFGAFGYTHAGEWSLGHTDCGLYLNGVGKGTRYEDGPKYIGYNSPAIGSCDPILDYANWNESYKQGLRDFGAASSDVLHNWFFWTWKIGASNVTGKIESPHWSYQLGLQGGWIPLDPRSSAGTCAAKGVNIPQGELLSWQTGGAGAGTIDAKQVGLYGAWPPSSMSAVTQVKGLPIYVQTAQPVTLSGIAPPSVGTYKPTATPSYGGGWFQPKDTVLAFAPLANCDYPEQWSASGAPVPACTPHAKKRNGQPGPIGRAEAPRPTITPAP